MCGSHDQESKNKNFLTRLSGSIRKSIRDKKKKSDEETARAIDKIDRETHAYMVEKDNQERMDQENHDKVVKEREEHIRKINNLLKPKLKQFQDQYDELCAKVADDPDKVFFELDKIEKKMKSVEKEIHIAMVDSNYFDNKPSKLFIKD